MYSPILSTPNLHLRPLQPTDLPAVISLRTNPLVFHWRPTPETPSASESWLKERLADPLALIYAVELKEKHDQDSGAGNSAGGKPTVIGLTGSHHLPEIGYIFSPGYWGRGYATEALQAWLRMYWSLYPNGHPALPEGAQEESKGGRGVVGVPYLVAETGAGSEGAGSARVLQKCGFVSSGRRDVRDGAEAEKLGRVVVLDCWRLERGVAGID